MHDRSDPSITLSVTLGGDTFTCSGPTQTVRSFLDLWLAARGGSESDPAVVPALKETAAKIRQHSAASHASEGKLTTIVQPAE